ncbi:MAG TPA: manganese-binding transcriptional regulator MntR [Phycisphaerales bacterium]|nr:manganese-binding transcriptional regulator MntR [Phycisphaerales bacterium]
MSSEGQRKNGRQRVERGGGGRGRSARARGGARGKPGRSRTVDQHADAFRKTRRAHVEETAEDYVEAVAGLIETRGEARVVDLARMLGVTHVTVSRTITRLQSRGLVTCEPYRAIFLTEAGRQLAARSKRRHEVVVAFLESIGVARATAETDAEGIEHHVSGETLSAMELHLNRFMERSAARRAGQ